jgi:hypothetical protein
MVHQTLTRVLYRKIAANIGNYAVITHPMTVLSNRNMDNQRCRSGAMMTLIVYVKDVYL